MSSSKNEKREAFMQSIKVDQSQTKNAKQSQFSSNNKSNGNSSSGNSSNGNSSSGNKADAPARGRSLGGGRGNER